MALIAIGGDSGMGKTSSLRNLDPAETFVVQVIPKALPFKGWKKDYPIYDPKANTGNRYVIFKTDPEEEEEKATKEFMDSAKKARAILRVVANKRPEIKTIVIDDSQYIMSYEYMARAKETGYERFSSIAQNFHSVIKVASGLSENIDIIFMHHTENIIVNDTQFTKLKTVGKLVDNIITFEGLFTIVLMAKVVSAEGKIDYLFETNTSGSNTAKSPMDMFGSMTIPNDLQIVLDAVREYEDG